MNKYDFEMNMEPGTKPVLIMDQITPGSTILEFGCANGIMTKYLLEQKNCSVSIVELEKEPFSKAICYAVDGICTNIETGEWQTYYAGKQFDYIIFADVLEHLRNAEQTLKDSKQFLKDNGKIIISIPNIAHNDVIALLFNNSFAYREIGILDNTHVRFWGEKELNSLAERNGFMLEILDGSYLAPFMTELNDEAADIPEALKAVLCNREYNEVYQFFLVLRKKKWAEAHSIKPDIRLKKFGSYNSATFYWDLGNGYQPELYSLIPGTEMQGTRTFRIENIPEGCVKVRFDPPAGGVFFVENCRAVINNEEYPLIPLNGLTINHNTYLFQNVHAQMEFSLPKNTSYFIVTAKITPCLKKDADYLESQLAINAQCQDELVRYNQNLVLMTEKNNNLLAHNQMLINENNSLHKDNQRLTDEKASFEHMFLEKKEAHQSLMNNFNALEQQYVLVEEQARRAEELQKTLEHLINDNRNLSIQYENVFAQYTTILNSQFWKITYPARLILDAAKRIIQKTALVRTAYKGIVYLKNNGLRSFLFKVKSYLQTKKSCKNSNKLVVSSLDLTPKAEEHYAEYDTSVSVVIPAFNGGSELVLLVRNLLEQQGIKEIEITIVDSGSTDSSIDICEQIGAKIIKISQKEFSHSYARNLGAENSHGEHILFMTQDALPTSKSWLYNMLTPIMNNGVVAVSCDEFPRDYCDLFHRICNYVHANYIGFANTDLICSLPDVINFETLRKNGQLNDVACLIKKDTFLKHKYSGDYAEDLALGIKLIQEGHKLCLLSSERVIHSHTRNAGYYLKRAVVDVINLSKILPGYPSSAPKLEQVVNRALSVYSVICSLCDMLKNNLNSLENINIFIKQFKDYMSLATNNINLSNLKYGKDYSDDLCDNFIKKISSLTHEQTFDSALVNDVFYFFDNFVFEYVKNNYDTLDKTIKLELINTLYKRTMVCIGAELANYFNSETGSTKLKELINDLKKGV